MRLAKMLRKEKEIDVSAVIIIKSHLNKNSVLCKIYNKYIANLQQFHR